MFLAFAKETDLSKLYAPDKYIYKQNIKKYLCEYLRHMKQLQPK